MSGYCDIHPEGAVLPCRHCNRNIGSRLLRCSFCEEFKDALDVINGVCTACYETQHYLFISELVIASDRERILKEYPDAN